MSHALYTSSGMFHSLGLFAYRRRYLVIAVRRSAEHAMRRRMNVTRTPVQVAVTQRILIVVARQATLPPSWSEAMGRLDQARQD